MTTTEAVVENLERTVGVMLPQRYRQFLLEGGGGDMVGWEMYAATEKAPDGLLRQICVDGRTGVAAQELMLHVPTLREMVHETGVDVLEPGRRGRAPRFDYERLSRTIAIGQRDGDILFIDPESNWAVWAFFHDGAYVKLVASSFAELAGNATEAVE